MMAFYFFAHAELAEAMYRQMKQSEENEKAAVAEKLRLETRVTLSCLLCPILDLGAGLALSIRSNTKAEESF